MVISVVEFQVLCWEAFVGGPNPPPLYRGLWVKPRPIHPAEKTEESKVQLWVSAQMFGQVIMSVYNGWVIPEVIP